jgi:hypothetical protein
MEQQIEKVRVPVALQAVSSFAESPTTKHPLFTEASHAGGTTGGIEGASIEPSRDGSLVLYVIIVFW